VHNNFIFGVDAKIERFKLRGLWHEDPKWAGGDRCLRSAFETLPSGYQVAAHLRTPKVRRRHRSRRLLEIWTF
jgi:hypothetical protein